jgi:Ni/Co efflux regulator RcnB
VVNRPGRYPLGAYRRPRGYYARQWAIGVTLPSLCRAQSYWISGPGRYGLRPPPPGTRWVRVDDDALLVSNRNGRIIEVVRNIFY